MNKRGFCFPKRAHASINVEWYYSADCSCTFPSCHVIPYSRHLHGVLVSCVLSEQRSLRGNTACVFVFRDYLCSREDKSRARTELRELIRGFPEGHASRLLCKYNGDRRFKDNITFDPMRRGFATIPPPYSIARELSSFLHLVHQSAPITLNLNWSFRRSDATCLVR